MVIKNKEKEASAGKTWQSYYDPNIISLAVDIILDLQETIRFYENKFCPSNMLMAEWLEEMAKERNERNERNS